MGNQRIKSVYFDNSELAKSWIHVLRAFCLQKECIWLSVGRWVGTRKIPPKKSGIFSCNGLFESGCFQCGNFRFLRISLYSWICQIRTPTFEKTIARKNPTFLFGKKHTHLPTESQMTFFWNWFKKFSKRPSIPNLTF